MTQQPQFAQTTATFQQVVPAKKVCLRKLRLFWRQSLVPWQRFYLLLGGYSLWRYQSGKIADGT